MIFYLNSHKCKNVLQRAVQMKYHTVLSGYNSVRIVPDKFQICQNDDRQGWKCFLSVWHPQLFCQQLPEALLP